MQRRGKILILKRVSSSSSFPRPLPRQPRPARLYHEQHSEFQEAVGHTCSALGFSGSFLSRLLEGTIPAWRRPRRLPPAASAQHARRQIRKAMLVVLGTQPGSATSLCNHLKTRWLSHRVRRGLTSHNTTSEADLSQSCSRKKHHPHELEKNTNHISSTAILRDICTVD